MRILYDYIFCNEYIIEIAPKVEFLTTDNVFSIKCRVRNRNTGLVSIKECLYSTINEAERKRFIWNKIFKKQFIRKES